MAANKAVANCFFVYKRGKAPVFEVQIQGDEMQRDIFARYYDKTIGMNYQMPHLIDDDNKGKKDNENENEYEAEDNPPIYISIKPVATAKLSAWKWLNSFYSKKWRPIISYHGVFNVCIYDLNYLGVLFIFYNSWDKEIQLFKLE